MRAHIQDGAESHFGLLKQSARERSTWGYIYTLYSHGPPEAIVACMCVILIHTARTFFRFDLTRERRTFILVIVRGASDIMRGVI